MYTYIHVTYNYRERDHISHYIYIIYILSWPWKRWERFLFVSNIWPFDRFFYVFSYRFFYVFVQEPTVFFTFQLTVFFSFLTFPTFRLPYGREGRFSTFSNILPLYCTVFFSFSASRQPFLAHRFFYVSDFGSPFFFSFQVTVFF